MRSPFHYVSTFDELHKAIQRRNPDMKSEFIYEYVAKMLGFRPKKGQRISITRMMFNKIFGGGSASSNESNAEAFWAAAGISGPRMSPAPPCRSETP